MKTTKMHGCRNTFLVVDDYFHELNRRIADYRLLSAPQDLADEVDRINEKLAEELVESNGFRPDGFLFVMPENGNFRMKYYDIDRKTGRAARANMCGNGIRCFARYVYDHYYTEPYLTIITDDGPKKVFISEKGVSVNMGPPREFCAVNKAEEMYFVNTSIAHIICFRDIDPYSPSDLEKARTDGRKIRFDKGLMERLGHPEGFRVNFVKLANGIDTAMSGIDIVTYESGVEDLIMACGTGATASAYVSARVKGFDYPILVRNRGGNVSVDMRNNNLYLIGPAEYM